MELQGLIGFSLQGFIIKEEILVIIRFRIDLESWYFIENCNVSHIGFTCKEWKCVDWLEFRVTQKLRGQSELAIKSTSNRVSDYLENSTYPLRLNALPSCYRQHTFSCVHTDFEGWIYQSTHCVSGFAFGVWWACLKSFHCPIKVACKGEVDTIDIVCLPVDTHRSQKIKNSCPSCHRGATKSWNCRSLSGPI
jgi:hypothetical protein